MKGTVAYAADAPEADGRYHVCLHSVHSRRQCSVPVSDSPLDFIVSGLVALAHLCAAWLLPCCSPSGIFTLSADAAVAPQSTHALACAPHLEQHLLRATRATCLGCVCATWSHAWSLPGGCHDHRVLQELSPSSSHVLARDARQRLFCVPTAEGAPGKGPDEGTHGAAQAVLLAEGAGYAQWAPDADVVVAQRTADCLLWPDPGCAGGCQAAARQRAAGQPGAGRSEPRPAESCCVCMIGRMRGRRPDAAAWRPGVTARAAGY